MAPTAPTRPWQQWASWRARVISSRPGRQPAASRLVSELSSLIACHHPLRITSTPLHLRSEHGPHEQPLLIRTVLLRECDELVDVPVARDILAPEHVRGALAREPDTKARRKLGRVAGERAGA
jgi:hypothetical protein